MSGGKGGGSQTVTQQVAIPEFLRPFVTQQAQIGNQALTNLQGQLKNAGADQLVAGFTPDQIAAMNQARALATDPNSVLAQVQQQLQGFAQQGTGRDQLLATARGDYLLGSPQSQAAVDAAVRSAMPAVISNFGGRGTGGLAQAAIAQQATDAFARQYDVERQRQLAASGQLAGQQQSALGALPGLAATPIDILNQIGASQQALAQRQLTAPITAQETLLQAAGGGVPLSSLLGSSQTSPLYSNPIGGAIGGGLLGLQLGGALSGLGGLGGAVAPAAGGFLTGGGVTSVGGAAASGAGLGSWLGPIGLGAGALLGGLLG